MAPLISNISEIISFLDTQAEIINEKKPSSNSSI